MIKQLITAGVIASSLGLGFSAQAAPLNENLCGGSPNGLWQLLGVGMDGVLKAENPDSSVTYQTSSGGFANIIQMQGDTCDLAIVHAGEAMKAISGEPPFPKAVNNFRAIGVLYNWAPMQWVMTQDFSDKYGIHSLQDIADKKPPLRLVLNRKGILPSMVGESSLKALGVTPDDIESWGGSVVYQGSAVATELVQNRRADMWANETFVGSSAISGMAENRPMTLLAVPDSVIKAMEEEYGDKPYTVSADAYTWLDHPVQTHTAAAMLVAPATMADDEAYRITKDLIEHIDVMQGVHPAMKQLTPETLLGQSVVELHPGAKRAYEEAGLL
ncbi:TAXI family TRAP transporter solute-binding subunit [Salinicola acroporae]|uniref:TRAP transporter substrate-binding protein n=1 Tax=Salinicola acroporae TaxID=1541440 RepID=A0ABT6IA80_9GAMM|nr:TAXI family TRAP transporter solute-binding subunit [Salinicola acroporae]MDH4573995.1 TRAP transporter substrate-binding protein [Salinicola acroporae]